MSDIELGEILTSTMRVTFRSFFRFLLLALIIGVPVGVIAMGIIYAIVGDFEWAAAEPESMGALIAVIYLIAVPGGLYFHAVVISDAYHGLINRQLSIAGALGEGLRRFPRLFLLMLVMLALYFVSFIPMGVLSAGAGAIAGGGSGYMVLGIAIYFLVWSIGAVALSCVWFVLFPVSVIEKRIVSGFSRAAFLTKGNRFLILAVILIFMAGGLGAYLVFFLMVGVASAIFDGSGAGQMTQVIVAVLGGVVYLVVVAGFTVLQSVLPTVVYHRLKSAKEGDEDQLADVFE